ncbi:MAG: ABC transporter ATP-binding protein [Rhodospirillaceae bacterium]|nr:ABC transporter ATP-binding protein [Rhodospirillaceae bacterium]MYB12697.1 ABC transporter ATP-binding protein [Rhodospirillaceae bacterium]MYI49408.1 ABC transporter ATP-binding protein [Rhodospirillaceae bacterium]
MAEPLLALDAVTAGYGATRVLEDLSLALGDRESVAVIGRNGVGKTTLLATVMGHTTLHGGAIRFAGQDISRLPVHRRAVAGIGYVPQEREIFPSLTVRENLEIGARPSAGKGGGGADDWTDARIFALFPQLEARLGNDGNQLSGGEQQMLAIARALMANPRILLMDEPTEGLAPVIVEELVRILAALRDEAGVAMVLVEQNSAIALNFAERTIVLDRGRVVYDGPSKALQDDPEKLERLVAVSG